MRLFVALEIPEDVRRQLEAGSRELRPVLPKARWVRSELMHLTLVFLGETDRELVPELDLRLREAFAAYRPLALRVSELGAFPPRGRKRVLWAGVDADADLRTVQAAAEKAVERATGEAMKKKGKPYHAHVTLARCQPPWPRSAVDRLAAGFGDDHSRPFRVAEGVLIESELPRPLGGRGGHPQRGVGPRYRTVSAYPLRGGS